MGQGREGTGEQRPVESVLKGSILKTGVTRRSLMDLTRNC